MPNLYLRDLTGAKDMMINNCYRLLCEITKLEQKIEEVQSLAKTHGLEIDTDKLLQELINKQAS
ncbi:MULTISPECIES: hypothetical protein [unclassified Halobacteriovorax]|nr:hypothetical protein [Halobacteriovorax sp. BALOs_7]AYF44259.1 hypothetical protein BALOs_1252 [Halobacteriovorax sp. BALOs_7]